MTGSAGIHGVSRGCAKPGDGNWPSIQPTGCPSNSRKACSSATGCGLNALTLPPFRACTTSRRAQGWGSRHSNWPACGRTAKPEARARCVMAASSLVCSTATACAGTRARRIAATAYAARTHAPGHGAASALVLCKRSHKVQVGPRVRKHSVIPSPPWQRRCVDLTGATGPRSRDAADIARRP